MRSNISVRKARRNARRGNATSAHVECAPPPVAASSSASDTLIMSRRMIAEMCFQARVNCLESMYAKAWSAHNDVSSAPAPKKVAAATTEAKVRADYGGGRCLSAMGVLKDRHSSGDSHSHHSCSRDSTTQKECRPPDEDRSVFRWSAALRVCTSNDIDHHPSMKLMLQNVAAAALSDFASRSAFSTFSMNYTTTQHS